MERWARVKYPEILNEYSFRKMTTDEKITKWSAGHFNGTNILGRGAYYVLKDWASNDYLPTEMAILPKQLS